MVSQTKHPLPICHKPARKLYGRQTNMKVSNQRIRVQRGLPPDPRHAIRRAHQQPRTDVTDTTMGPHLGLVWQIRTEAREENQKPTKLSTYAPTTPAR